jgi:lysozyme
MKISRRGAALIASFEGFVDHPYNDQANHATIGYGHLIHLGPVTDADRKKWGTMSKSLALKYLTADAAAAAEAVETHVKRPLSQARFDALVSFTFNCGVGAFNGSTLLKLYNKGDIEGTVAQFGKWVKAGGKTFPGLVDRRNVEAAIFAANAWWVYDFVKKSPNL